MTGGPAASAVTGRRVGQGHRGWSRGVARWAACFLAAALAHALAAVMLLPGDLPVPAPEAPEAAIMIDLPPELALPPAETVESLASEPAEDVPPANAAEQADAAEASDSAVADVEDAPSTPEPVEAISAAEVPEAASTAPEPAQALEGLADAAGEPPADTEPAMDPPDVAESMPPVEPAGAAEAPSEEAAEDAPMEVAVSEVAEPAPAPRVVPRSKPQRAERTSPKKAPPPPKAAGREGAELLAKPRRQAASRSAAGQKASGAGKPDRNALSRFMSIVRADILRQRRSVSIGGGGTATVRFTITASGALQGIGLASSSGNPALDAAALALVRRASPVPAIPREVGRSSLTTQLPVRLD